MSNPRIDTNQQKINERLESYYRDASGDVQLPQPSIKAATSDLGFFSEIRHKRIQAYYNDISASSAQAGSSNEAGNGQTCTLS